ncbi:hypothetical protein BDV12DRAFT_205706 [Aspergillus spectabilis]
MLVLKSLSLALLLPFAQAGKPRCFDFSLPIHVSLPITQFNISPFEDNYESIGLLVKSVGRTANASELIAGQYNLDQSYNISFRYCEPSRRSTKNGAIQVLTHGLGFDKAYWDFSAEYSYITSATSAGYATLSYDRLGVGHSTHANPYLDVQASTHVAILAQISALIQSGSLSLRIPTPTKIVHVGHSFGSLVVNSLVAKSPHLADAVILTGFGHDFSWSANFQLCWGFEIAELNNPRRFAGYDSGYLTWGDEFDNQCAAFTYPYFDPRILRKAESTKAPFAIAELLSFGITEVVAPGFTGPVLILNGEQDLSFCGGDCHGVLDAPDSPSSSVFPNASLLAAYIHPNAGHAVNLHRNATGAYGVIFNFLKGNGM